jgi:hypothetical protein
LCLQVVCPYRCIEERAMPLKQMGDLGQVRGLGICVFCALGGGVMLFNLQLM